MKETALAVYYMGKLIAGGSKKAHKSAIGREKKHQSFGPVRCLDRFRRRSGYVTVAHSSFTKEHECSVASFSVET